MRKEQTLKNSLTGYQKSHKPHQLYVFSFLRKGLEACTRAILKVGLERPGSHLLQRSTLPPITNTMSLMVKLAELRSRHKIVVSKGSKDLNMAQDILNLLCSTVRSLLIILYLSHNATIFYLQQLIFKQNMHWSGP